MKRFKQLILLAIAATASESMAHPPNPLPKPNLSFLIDQTLTLNTNRFEMRPNISLGVTIPLRDECLQIVEEGSESRSNPSCIDPNVQQIQGNVTVYRRRDGSLFVDREAYSRAQRDALRDALGMNRPKQYVPLTRPDGSPTGLTERFFPDPCGSGGSYCWNGVPLGQGLRP